MISKRQQKGMSAWVAIYILITLGFFGLIGLKTFPTYLESFKVDKALQALVDDPKTADMSKREIGSALVKRLDIDDVTRINDRTLGDFVTITKTGKKVSVVVDYRAEVPLFANVIVVTEFRKEASN